MKKILVPLLMTVLCLSLVACNASEPAQSEGSTSIPAASQNTENTSPLETTQNKETTTTSEMEENENHLSESEAEQSNQTSEPNPTQSPSTPATEPSGSKPSTENESNVLVAYFSWADNAVLDDNVDAVSSPSVIVPGNVQQLAGWVQEETGGDLFPFKSQSHIPATGMNAWIAPMRSGAATLGPRSPGRLRTWTSTIRCFWAIQTGGMVYPWRCSHSWKKMISLGRRSTCSALMALGDWLGAYRLLRRRHPMQSFQKISLIVMKKKRRQRRQISKVGLVNSDISVLMYWYYNQKMS